jgi:hypothetical protein
MVDGTRPVRVICSIAAIHGFVGFLTNQFLFIIGDIPGDFAVSRFAPFHSVEGFFKEPCVYSE